MNEIERLKQQQKFPTEGYIWHSILIKYDFAKGTSEVVRSFSRPAKDSSIKAIQKTKPKKDTIKFTKEETSNIDLF